MKSIRRFRTGRQALEAVRPKQSRRSRRDEEIEFPLGPRIPGKDELRRREPEEVLIIHERTVPGREEYPGAFKGAPRSEIDGGPPAAIQNENVKSPPAEERAAKPSPAKDTSAPVSAEVAAGKPRPEGSRPAREIEPNVTARGDQPVLVAPLAETQTGGETSSGTPGTSNGKQGTASGRQGKKTPVDDPENRLRPYAVKVGAHSYVLVDDEGHLVKRTSNRKHT